MNIQNLIEKLQEINAKHLQCVDVNGDDINSIEIYMGRVYITFDEEKIQNDDLS